MNRFLVGFLALVFCCTSFAANKKKTITLEPVGFKKIVDTKNKKGTVIFYSVKKKDFGGTMPECLDFKYPNKDFRFANAYYVDKYYLLEEPKYDVAHDDEREMGYFQDNFENREVELWLYFSGEIKDWHKVKLFIVGVYLSPKTRKNNMFFRDTDKIKWLVGLSTGEEEGIYDISISEKAPDIKVVLKQARELAKKYGFKIGEVNLKNDR